MKEFADILSIYRAFPRLFSVFFMYLLDRVIVWYMELPAPPVEQSGFAAMVVGTGAAWFKVYVDGGKGK